ncbi:MAG: crosslink repair DNA glycosylase YcaQ family protein [Woeseiaceae bacterium]|nr:crosslink repair DNA glycosylase YcaQ family protein [Woeseiaceae bacterium]
MALEHHFGRGRLAVTDRLANFQRVYDLPERVSPARQREVRMEDETAQRALLGRAARALGIATSRDLADYFRMTLRTAAPRLAELEEEGCIRQVVVEGWAEPAWLAADARVPRRVEASALLSPFDPLVWYRPRAERLFDFHYRIEIYVPAHRRRWGYYVLPFLCGDRLAARVDLKAERAVGVLRVRAAHLEPGENANEVAAALARELGTLADWLGLETVRVARRGNLAATLRRSAAARMDYS